jgi:hypothetical protein
LKTWSFAEWKEVRALCFSILGRFPTTCSPSPPPYRDFYMYVARSRFLQGPPQGKQKRRNDPGCKSGGGPRESPHQRARQCPAGRSGAPGSRAPQVVSLRVPRQPPAFRLRLGCAKILKSHRHSVSEVW